MLIQGPIDLRSDTVTRPTPEMWEAMRTAELGDDVFGDDHATNQLEAAIAERLGFEAGLFLPSGTQSNLVALLTHCGRGDEYIAAQGAHCYRYEGGGAAALGGIQPQPLSTAPDGTMDLREIQAAIKPDDPHFARTRLVCLEDTFGGRVLPKAYPQQVRDLCDRHGLRLHLDGARLFNAIVATGDDPAKRCAPYDSVSVCFSKGLGAPAGSALCGSAGFIARSRRWRKVVGGGLRQAGVLAAACHYALDHHVEHLHRDHLCAATLAQELRDRGLQAQAHTNMVWLTVELGKEPSLVERLRQEGFLVRGGSPMRLVFHRDLPAATLDRLVSSFHSWIIDSEIEEATDP